MLKIFKMDLYRMIKNKSTWIIMAINMVFLLLPIIIEGVVLKNSNQSIVGVKDFSSYLTSFIAGGTSMMLIAIFVVLFYGSIYKTGFIKNVANLAKSKHEFVLSIVFISIIYTLIMFIATFIVAFLAMFVVFGKANIGSPLELIKYMACQFVAYSAMMSFAILICTLVRKSGAAMAICILYFSGFGINLWYLISTAIMYLFKTEFNICNYLVSHNIMRYSMKTVVSEEWWKMPVISFCYFVVFVVISSIVMNKREID
ncbi:hypothetical protein SAMN02745248_02186 [Hathewaya proteolytica DSM 3090]|uniref:ABC-2 type transport system permease protein n=1 Tax=Hathewaya proteolytica DSM 3090 TaxID=1121331 RepID=A0A1M6R2Z6_9CLOT|nr:hypothetical protein [Hathewaya proteolytica]SHK26875.1 hypothetical protein SAMN02745248_02186 [Hathewaya proteolytica DSM 3090]